VRVVDDQPTVQITTIGRRLLSSIAERISGIVLWTCVENTPAKRIGIIIEVTAIIII